MSADPVGDLDHDNGDNSANNHPFMLWIILSILTAITVACRDVFVKAISPTTPPIHIMAMELLWGIPFLAAALIFVEVPPLDHIFWRDFILSLPITAIAYYLYLLAITGSAPLSSTLPMLSFTPLFMIVSGALILGERVNLQGGAGILLIVAGSYVLNIKKIKEGLWLPFLTLVHNISSRYMLVVAFIYSIVAVLGKSAMLHSSPMFFSLSFFLVFNSLTVTTLFLNGKLRRTGFSSHSYRNGCILGGLLFLQAVLHGYAITLSSAAAYMIAIKRTSVLFAMLMGWYYFKERDILTRAAGALLMFTGTLIISWHG